MQVPPFVSFFKYGFWSHERTHSISAWSYENAANERNNACVRERFGGNHCLLGWPHPLRYIIVSRYRNDAITMTQCSCWYLCGVCLKYHLHAGFCSVLNIVSNTNWLNSIYKAHDSRGPKVAFYFVSEVNSTFVSNNLVGPQLKTRTISCKRERRLLCKCPQLTEYC